MSRCSAIYIFIGIGAPPEQTVNLIEELHTPGGILIQTLSNVEGIDQLLPHLKRNLQAQVFFYSGSTDGICYVEETFHAPHDCE